MMIRAMLITIPIISHLRILDAASIEFSMTRVETNSQFMS
jgi:hypothetical protein